MANKDLVIKLYEPLLREAREHFAGRTAVASILSPDTDPDALERFLLAFCAYGVSMTEPVEGWIRRAGTRCIEMGLDALGTALCEHARDEAGHHELMIADTRKLVERWNRRRKPELDADKVLALELPSSVSKYRELHEHTIAGDAPFGQLAIEYEIESLSVRFGSAFLSNCSTLLGKDILASLTFMKEHVAQDGAHTTFNRHRLEELLAREPRYARELGRVGAEALGAYAAFLEDCWDA